MSNAPSRYVLVDDTDPRILYEGEGWRLTTAGTTESWGIYGPTYNRTLHETWSDGSFTFKFSGTGFHVHATIDTENDRVRPSWLCTLDGESTGRVTPDGGQHTNHWIVCENEDLSGLEEHTLKVDVTVPSGAAFWLDAINYVPTVDITRGETLLIHERDNTISFSPPENWNFTDGITQNTDIDGSSMTFKFTGTSVTFFSVLRPNLPSSTGKYTIDGGSETSFTIPGHEDVNRLFNLPLFSVDNLSPGEHALVTTYTGSRGHTPLSFDYFSIALPPANDPTQSTPATNSVGASGTPTGTGAGQSSGAPSLRPSVTGGGPDTPSSPSPSDTGSSSSTPLGPIVGGAIGGFVGLAIVGILHFLLLRPKRRQEPYAASTPFMSAIPEPVSIIPSPNRAVPGSQSSPSTSQYNPYNTSSASNGGDRASSVLAKQRQGLRELPTNSRCSPCRQWCTS